LGKFDGIIVETKMVDPIGAFCEGKKAFAIGAFHPYHEVVFPFPQKGPRIKRRIDTHPFHKIGVSLGVKIIAPEERSVGRREDRVFISKIDTIAGIDRFVRPIDESLIFSL